jgi:4-amino-4-deoxy-L-arabinose transferase-like glycosyltransferase
LSPAFRNVLLLSAALKIVLAVVFADLAPRYDEIEYVRFGAEIRDLGAEPRLWRAPLHQWFIAGTSAITGGRLIGTRLAQALLSILATWLTYRIGRRIRGERAGFWAGALVAFYPSHIAFAH